MPSISKPSLWYIIGLLGFSFIVLYETLKLNRTETLSAQTSPLRFPEQVHDFGVVACNSSSHYTFVTKNDLNVALIIDHVAKSCGCTLAQVEPLKVMPGQNWDVVTELSAADVPASMSSEVFIEGRTGPTPMKALFALHAKAEAILTFPGQSGVIDLGDVPLTASPAKLQFVVKSGKYPLQFDTLHVDPSSNGLFTRVLPLPNREWKIKLQINSDNDSLGTMGYLLKFRFSKQGKNLPETIDKQVYFDLLGPVLASPSSLMFYAQPGEKTHQSIEVEDRQSPKGTMLEVTGTSCNSKNIRVYYPDAVLHNTVSVDYTAPEKLLGERGTILLNILDPNQNRHYKLHVNYLAVVSN